MTSLPTGMVAFLLTDIEGSSRLWETDPKAMGAALVEHDRRLRQVVAAHQGRVFATAGDSIAASFQSSVEAITAALEAQKEMADLSASDRPVRVRMAVHAGVAEERDGDYFGPVLNRCGRLRDAAHGGQIVISQTVKEQLPTDLFDNAVLLDLGEHRLRDLERPEWIFQISVPTLQDSFPPLRTLTKATTNFPIQLTSFVGRDQELEEVAKLVRGSRLVTLTGAGGSGKTRLALQAAASLSAEFSDGMWLVDLAAVSEPDRVLTEVAGVFDLTEQSDRPLLESLIEYLRPLQTLVLLDNCEHLLEEVCRVTVALLGSTQKLQILTTSRESLHMPGEVTYQVPPLGVPPAAISVDARAAAGYDAVRLFVTRAENSRAGFRLTAAMSGPVSEICRRLDGIPLAIELAAARMSSLTPQQIASHLDHRFRLLSGARRGGLPRQETLQSTIDWSFSLLTDAERRHFVDLSVFRSDFSLEAGQRILARNGVDELDLLDVIPRLVDKSLVVAEPVRGEMRYRFLETIRQYAVERWSTTDGTEVVEESHRRFFLEVAEYGAANLRSGKHEEVLSRLELEHENFRQAIRSSLDRGDLEIGMRIAGALYRFWLYTDRDVEGAKWLESILSQSGAVPDHVRAKALLGVGILVGNQLGGHTRGIDALREAMSLYRSVEHDDNTILDYATAVNGLGVLLNESGESTEAEACFEEALGIARQLDMLWGIAVATGNLGRIAARDGRIDQARSRFGESVAVARQLASPRIIGDALEPKAALERDRGNLAVAVADYQEIVDSYTEAGYLMGARWAEANMAIALLRLGEHDRAVAMFRRNAREVLGHEESGNLTSAIIELALGRAEIAMFAGDVERAARLMGFVASIIETGGSDENRHWLVKLTDQLTTSDGGDLAFGEGRVLDVDQVRSLILEE